MHWDVVRPWRTGNSFTDDSKVKRFFNTLYKLNLSDQMAYWEMSDLGGIYFEDPNDEDKFG
jgi:hypothetical protein